MHACSVTRDNLFCDWHTCMCEGIITTNFTPQGSGVVRFFHHKCQCYIEGEGSFIGKHGHLPEKVDEHQDVDVDIANKLRESSRRCLSTCNISPSNVNKKSRSSVTSRHLHTQSISCSIIEPFTGNYLQSIDTSSSHSSKDDTVTEEGEDSGFLQWPIKMLISCNDFISN